MKVLWSLHFYLNFLQKYTARRVFLYFPFTFAEENLNREKPESPQRWPECIHRILSNCTVRQVWRLCGLAKCCLAPLAGPLTSDVCVFWAAAQSRVQPVSGLGQTKQTKPVQPPKEKHDQDQQTDLNTQEEDKISMTRTAFAACCRRVGSASEVIPGCRLGNWLAKKNRSTVGEAFGR